MAKTDIILNGLNYYSISKTFFEIVKNQD